MGAPRPWARALLAHPRHAALAALVGGLAAGPRLPDAVMWLVAAAGLVALLATLSAGAVGGRVAVVLAICGLGALAGAGLAAARLAALDHTRLGPWLGHAVALRVTLLQAPRARSFGRVAALARIEAGPGRGERLLLRARGRLPGAVGAELRVRGGLLALPPFESAARRAGAHALLAAEAASATGRRRGGLAGAIDAVRARSERALATGLPGPLAGLARGMVLGQDEALERRMAEDFRASGLAHLVAASGANVALLAALALGIGALLGLPRAPRLWLAAALVAGYVPLAGGGASIQRAGVMGVATLAAALASQPASRVYALLLAAAATLALNPRAVEDPGWQLSFAAVVSLMAHAPPLRRALERRRVPRPAAEALAAALAATAATAPLIALHFGRLSWVTVPANLLALPAVAPVMWLGALAAAAGQLSSALAAPLMALAGWPLAFLAAVARAAAALPGAGAELAVGPALAAVWGAALVALAVPRVRRGLLGRARPAQVARRAAFAAALGALAAAALAGGRGAPPPSGGLVVSALDVGQGDATLIQHGARAILVDTGPPGGPIVARLREAGVRRLDLLVVTHAQEDHDGGVPAVLGAFPVAAVLDGGAGARGAAATALRASGARLLAPGAGQRLRAGPLALDVLWPPSGERARAGEDPNQRAIVAVLRDGGFSMLLSSDAETDVTAALPLGPVDVLKVAHHGSADRGLAAQLERLRPAVALIEVGRANRYGHPAPATLDALRAVPTVLRTDRDGTVRLHVDGASIAVERHA